MWILGIYIHLRTVHWIHYTSHLIRKGQNLIRIMHRTLHIAYFYDCRNAFLSAFGHMKCIGNKNEKKNREKNNNIVVIWFHHIKIDMQVTAINRNKVVKYTQYIPYIQYVSHFLVQIHIHFQLSAFCYFSCHSYDQTSVKRIHWRNESFVCQLYFTKRVCTEMGWIPWLRNLCGKCREHKKSTKILTTE